MELIKAILNVLCFILVDSLVVVKDGDNGDIKKDIDTEADIEDVFNGVYTECFVHLSYACIQNKTLMYLEELNKLSEVPIVGNYVKLVRLNTTKQETNEESHKGKSSKELSIMIDKAVDRFFDNHVVKFNVMGRNVSVPTTVEEFVGRKKRKGGGGGGGGGHGGDDGGKKKMMMMAMMCMKMKLMMMVPAMMGMMGMMSFKGMMFSMMSFMISKMMLLMKLLEKKGGGGPGGGAVGDGGWAAASGGGGSWMPAGGQDFGGASGGYDANAQWQSRTLLDSEKPQVIENPLVSFVPPALKFSNKFVNDNKFDAVVKNRRVTTRLVKEENKPKSRKKRGIIDILQNSYLYWMNKFLGVNNNRRTQLKYPKFRIVNGIKYVYHPYKMIPKVKSQEVVPHVKQLDDGFKPIITAEDFNKGEIVEGGVESRMIRKKFHKMKDTVNDTVDDNPWE